MSQSTHIETIQVHAGQEHPDLSTGARAVPIYATTSYVFPTSESAAARFGLAEAGNIYSRLTNPTVAAFENRVAALEGGTAAVAFSSGSAAITAAIENVAGAGDHVVASTNLYGGTANLFSHTLRDLGIETTFVDQTDLEAVEAAIRPETKLLYAETLGNPGSEVLDIESWSAIAHRHGLPLIVDATFSTPALFRPLEHGADVVVHSATKFLGGHGAAMGGVLVDGGTFDWAASDAFPGLSQPNPSYHGLVFSDAGGNAAYALKARATLLRDQGACLSPFDAFLLLLGTETLSLRVERQVENALAVVGFLSRHPLVGRVDHPSLAEGREGELYRRFYPNGGASIFTFDIDGSADEARLFTESLELFSLLANVADVKSLVIHPASTTHSQLSEDELLAAGIRPQTVRLSIGTEHVDDIIADLERGFAAVEASRA